LVALTVLVLILFPVISVTDDLMAMQNPAETDSSLRRNQALSQAHSILPPVAMPPLPALAGLSSGFQHLAVPDSRSAVAIDHPGLASIQNRPPPVG
jgi:hypothetical protein